MTPAAARPAPLRVLYVSAGLACVLLGVIGLVVPLMPSTVFFILAAGALARGSPALEAWLLNHPQIGPSITAWRTRGAIPTRAKLLATAGLGIGLVGLFLVRPDWPIVLLSGAAATGALAFVWTRPG